MAPKIIGNSGSGKTAMNVLSCVVPFCKSNLLKESHISIKSGTCEAHRTAFSVTKEGLSMRFCQKCAKLQPLDAFDGEKRACREKLDQHNARRRQQHKEKREQKSLEERNAKASETLIKPDSENSTIFYPREAGNYQGPAGPNNPSDCRDVEHISDTQGTSPRWPDDDPQSYERQDAPPTRRHCDGDVRCPGDHMSQNYHAFSRVAQGNVHVPPDQSMERFPQQPFYYEPPMPAQYDLGAQAYKRAVAATLQRGLEDLADIATTDTEALWQIVGNVVTSLTTERRRWDRAAELQERQIAAAWSMAAALGAAGHHQQHPYNRHREGGQGSGGRNVTTSPRDHVQHPSHLRQAPYPMPGPGAARPQGPNLGVNSAYYGHAWAIASRPGPK